MLEFHIWTKTFWPRCLPNPSLHVTFSSPVMSHNGDTGALNGSCAGAQTIFRVVISRYHLETLCTSYGGIVSLLGTDLLKFVLTSSRTRQERGIRLYGPLSGAAYTLCFVLLKWREKLDSNQCCIVLETSRMAAILFSCKTTLGQEDSNLQPSD